MLYSKFLVVSLSFCLLLVATVQSNTSLDQILHLACDVGDLPTAFKECKLLGESAEVLHVLASLELILNSESKRAVDLHLEAKTINKVIPPLAKLHLDGKTCGGLSDLFYVAAVVTKELVDSNMDHSKLLSGLITLITLTSDSGLHTAAEKHIQHALRLSNHTVEYTSFQFRSALMTPGVYDSKKHIGKTRDLLSSRIENLIISANDKTNTFKLSSLDEFVLSPTFYFIYQGYNDRDILTSLHEAYSIAYPPLSKVEIEKNMRDKKYYFQQQQQHVQQQIEPVASTGHRKIRVGFVSSYFRRHSICKLFCGLLTHLDPHLFDVVAFSSLQESHEDKHTLALKRSGGTTGNIEFVTLGKTLIQNRYEVTSRDIDVLIYLDVGMEPSTLVWAAARLAPIQMCLWGHPSTTGLKSIDYYVSSSLYHDMHHYNEIVNSTSAFNTAIATTLKSSTDRVNYTAQDSFLEQLVQFESLGFYFERPIVEVIMHSVVNNSANDINDTKESMKAYSNELVSRTDSYYEQIMSQLQSLNTSGSNSIYPLVYDKYYRNSKIILCTQHLPKFHPDFDAVLGDLLVKIPSAVIVLLDNKNKYQWRRTLMARFKKSFTKIVNDIINNTPLEEQIRMSGLHGRKFTGDSVLMNNITTVENMLSRIMWLPSLTPSEYLLLMSIGDVSLDPFPFGGGVTTLESLAVCTPVVTLPSRQNVPSLAAGMIRAIHLGHRMEKKFVVVNDEKQYVETVVQLLSDDQGSSVRMDDLSGVDYVSDSDGGTYSENIVDGRDEVVVSIDEAGNILAIADQVGEDDVLNRVRRRRDDVNTITQWTSLLVQVRHDICEKVHTIFEQKVSVYEWETFLRRVNHM